jgi:uncharacterized protein
MGKRRGGAVNDSAFREAPDDIYVLPMGEKWLLVSPRNWTCAMVNRAAVGAVAACAAGQATNASELVQNLWRQLAEPSANPPAPPSALEKLVIIPTRSCNLRCVYCDFGAPGARTKTLDPRLACRLIDHAVANRSTSPALLRIHFFGGEPLLARSCVETVVHYARMVSARAGLTPWFEITTNGLLDSTAVPFFGDYMDSVVISLDGTGPVHDFNRRRADGGGTYAAIAENIHQLSRFPVELSLRACVTNRSVDTLPAMTSHFCSEFEFDLLCLEMLVPNQSTQGAGLSPPDPYRFAAGVLKAEGLAAAHCVKVIHGPSELAGPRMTSCPVGRGTLMLNPDGLLTACYLPAERWTSRGLDPVLGRVDPVSGPVIERQKLDAIGALLESKPRCARCFCRHTCAGGCHIEQTPPGCSPGYDDRCRGTRLITAGRLLRNLEGAAAAEAFAEQPSTMRGLAENPDDRLTAWTSGLDWRRR